MKEITKLKKQLREAVANYIRSEGCHCCESTNHSKHQEVLAKLLNVPKYEDNSGYDFYKFATREDETKN